MNTPRTDAEHAKTLTPAYEYVGAEEEAWEWARKLELELAKSVVLKLEDWTPERWEAICSIQRPEALWISGEQMDRLMALEKELIEAKLFLQIALDRAEMSGNHLIKLINGIAKIDEMNLWQRLKWAITKK